MGTILQFPGGPSAIDRSDPLVNSTSPPGAPSNVVLFTGVRYERVAEPLPSDLPPDPPAGPKPNSRKKRTDVSPPQVRAK